MIVESIWYDRSVTAPQARREPVLLRLSEDRNGTIKESSFPSREREVNKQRNERPGVSSPLRSVKSSTTFCGIETGGSLFSCPSVQNGVRLVLLPQFQRSDMNGCVSYWRLPFAVC